jgi:hypothetical protein
VIGVPQQWLDNNDRPGPTKKQKSSGSGQEGGSIDGPPHNDGRYGTRGTPFDMNNSNRKPAAQEKNGIGNNPSVPPAFAQSSEIKALLWKHHDVQLGMVAVAAGFVRGTKDLPTNGIPKSCCLLWLCFGKCNYDKGRPALCLP